MVVPAQNNAHYRDMGVDRAYVSGLELGQRNPTIVTLWHLTKALGVSLKAFFDEEKPRRRTN